MDEAVARAKSAVWGYALLRRGKVLCMRFDPERVVLVEPDGGYLYIPHSEVERCEMPQEMVLASAITGTNPGLLAEISEFCAEPRTMEEVEDQFPNVEAWRLRKCSLLKDAGRRNRRIVSVWNGADLPRLVATVYEMSRVGSRNDNSTPSNRVEHYLSTNVGHDP